VPKKFVTRIRKVEPIGEDSVRIYWAVERDGAWEDRAVLEMTMAAALENARFLMRAIAEIHTETELAVPSLPH
jgi:hypothetical protein